MYYPKSHITPNLYSNGELVYTSSKKTYIGPYFSTINGKYFTGRFPNDGTNLPLTYISKTEPHTLNEDSEAETDYRFDGDNSVYSNLRNINKDSISYYTPPPFYPQPSIEDYKLGEFRRYFTKKSNENLYYETERLFQNDLYIGFYIPWVISGDKEKVYNTNKSLVELREKELNITQFGDYLKHNYLKFYK